MQDSPEIIFTNEMYRRLRSDSKKIIKTPQQQKDYDDQVNFEAKALIKSRICHVDGQNSLLGISVSDLSGIHKDKIIEELKVHFNRYELMEEVRCLINTIIDIKDGDTESERARIHAYLYNLRQFGAPSSFNFALRGNIEHSISDKLYDKVAGEMVVVKCPRESSSSKELIHELVIGTKVLNVLRKWIPNFSYVYDAFSCSAPVINKNKENTNWCMNTKNPVEYVIYENIQNAVAIGDLCNEFNEDVANHALMYIMQCSLALYLAEKTNNFAHCDCHHENVLLRPYSEKEFYIPYAFEKKLYYVPSPGKIATFIDYGMSRATIYDSKGQVRQNVGKLDASGWFANRGIGKYHSTAIADIYKLLCFLIRYGMSKKNDPLCRALMRIFRGYFFGNFEIDVDIISYIIENQYKQRYHVPPDVVADKGWNLRDFIVTLNDFSIKEYGLTLLNSQEPPSEKIFGYLKSTDPDAEEIKEIIGADIPEIPSFFDLVQAPNNSRIKENILRNFETVIHNEDMDVLKISTSHQSAIIALPASRESIMKLNIFSTNLIDSFAAVVESTYQLKEKLKNYSVVKSILRSHSEQISEMTMKVAKKFEKNVFYIKKLYPTLVKNYETLQMVIFNRVSKDLPSADEITVAADGDNLYNLYDKTQKVCLAIESLQII